MDTLHEKYLIAGALLSCAFFFVTGYFWGKRSIANEYHSLLRQYTLDEKIQGALCSLARNGYLAKRSSEKNAEEDEGEVKNKEQVVKQVEKDEAPGQTKKDAAATKTSEKKAIVIPPLVKKNKEKRAYAQLVGFGSLESATKYRQKLLLAGYPVHVVERCLKVQKGKRMCDRKWYQVVTDVMPLGKVQNMVVTIARKDKLTGTKIIKV